jgi:hypothetical protein
MSDIKTVAKDTKYEIPKVGDYLRFDKIGLVKVVDRGVFVRANGRGSSYSIVEDMDGTMIKNSDGHVAWFYDDFLTDRNFKVK